MNKWFGRFPYPGWIILLLAFLLGAQIVYKLEKPQFNKYHLAQKIQIDFNKREAAAYVDARTGFFKRNIQDTTDLVMKQQYDWIIVQNGQEISWNNNNITLTPFMKANPDSFREGRITRLNYTTYFLKSWQIGDLDSTYALTFIPILYKFAFENKYFKSRFLADNRIPISTIVSDTMLPQSFPILTNAKQPVFYLQFQENTSKSYISGMGVWVFSLAFFFCLFIIVHNSCILIAKEHKAIYALGLLVGFIALLSFLLYKFGLPSGMMNASIFSPKLLASNELIGSLGSLIYLSLCDTWILLFVLNYVEIPSLKVSGKTALLITARFIGVIVLVYILFFIQADRIYKLIIDSKISFEVSDFSKLNIYTFLGLFVLSVITINFILILSVVSELLSGVINSKIFRYFIVLFLGLLCMYILKEKDMLFFYLIILFMCVAGMALLDAFGSPIQLFNEKVELSQSGHTYLWFILLCAWISVEVLYFNYSKEKEIRKIFAGKQEQRDDALTTFAFENLSQNIQEDQMLVGFLKKPAPELKADLDKQINYRYIIGDLSKFQVYLYYYDKNRLPIFGQDTLDKPLIRTAEKILNTPMKSGIVYINEQSSRNLYWGMVPILSDKSKDTLGFVGFNFAANKHPAKNYVSSLLQRNYNPADQQYFDNYSFAIYKDGSLWTQGGEVVFPFKTTYENQGIEYHFKENLFNSTLYYTASSNELILISYSRNILINAISLFSYVLAVLLLLMGVIFSLRYFVFYPIKGKIWRRRKLNLTIRSKVNLTVLVTVFLSLIVVGIITVSFLKKRYKDSQQKNLKNLIFYFGQNIIHYIEDNTLDLAPSNTDSSKVFSELSYRLNALAAEQSVNINLYNKDGLLIATSQSEMVQKDFMSNYMNRSAFLDLKTGTYPDLFVSEKMGLLDYESLYLPLRNRNDQIVAYMNLPYYSSQIELKEEISNILATLINIYTLIFLISGISAIFISNSIIKSFSLLIQQFRTVRLQHNVLLNWPYRDELGLLVKEYNTMIIKVEDMAMKLASNEREAAWRDLALQVAHEIKNPLTPMKLNIQYLQNAIKSRREDMPELASRITQSLIEEIENLNIIATEFAHFAKMPESNPELFNVKEMLSSIVELLTVKDGNEIRLLGNEVDVQIIMDKSYFRRIFTNLIKNASQAIPDDKIGKITVSFKKIDKKVLITVKDNGIGIDPELQKKMFTPYFTTKSSGTGIGLSMSKKMVEHAHGKIWFDTQRGVGTTFFIQFPVV